MTWESTIRLTLLDDAQIINKEKGTHMFFVHGSETCLRT